MAKKRRKLQAWQRQRRRIQNIMSRIRGEGGIEIDFKLPALPKTAEEKRRQARELKKIKAGDIRAKTTYVDTDTGEAYPESERRERARMRRAEEAAAPQFPEAAYEEPGGQENIDENRAYWQAIIDGFIKTFWKENQMEAAKKLMDELISRLSLWQVAEALENAANGGERLSITFAYEEGGVLTAYLNETLDLFPDVGELQKQNLLESMRGNGRGGWTLEEGGY